MRQSYTYPPSRQARSVRYLVGQWLALANLVRMKPRWLFDPARRILLTRPFRRLIRETWTFIAGGRP